MNVFILIWNYIDKSAYGIYKVFLKRAQAEQEVKHLKAISNDRDWQIFESPIEKEVELPAATRQCTCTYRCVEGPCSCCGPTGNGCHAWGGR